jgi:hypothetical protein
VIRQAVLALTLPSALWLAGFVFNAGGADLALYCHGTPADFGRIQVSSDRQDDLYQAHPTTSRSKRVVFL